ncbi:hypothetical protein OEZ86_009757 [Tetradesmus obliquus]|nr:hypothetical protein OEZ86_009757 [Tetradesmus obliquus]
MGEKLGRGRMASKPEGWRARVAGGRGSSPAATSSRQANTDRSRSRSPAGSHSAVTERKRIVHAAAVS